ncbi:MAG: hypothetical protein ACK6D7_01400 [Acidobacteriota bacterium]|jgi:hypothetical protein
MAAFQVTSEGLGRLLINFLLCTSGALKDPILYPSLFFKANRQAYYDHLTQRLVAFSVLHGQANIVQIDIAFGASEN